MKPAEEPSHTPPEGSTSVTKPRSPSPTPPPKNAPAAEKSMQAMSTSEVKDFIKTAVDRRIKAWGQKLLGFIGISTLVAAIGLYVTARDEAKNEARTVAKDSVDPMTTIVETTLSDSLKKVVDRRTEIETAITANETKVKTLADQISDQRKTLDSDSATVTSLLAATKTATEQLKEAQDNLDTVNKMNVQQLAEVYRQFVGKNPDVAAKLDQILTAQKRSATYGLQSAFVSDGNITECVWAPRDTKELVHQMNPQNSPQVAEKLTQVFEKYLVQINTSGLNVLVSLPPHAKLLGYWNVPTPNAAIYSPNAIPFVVNSGDVDSNADFQTLFVATQDHVPRVLYFFYETPLQTDSK